MRLRLRLRLALLASQWAQLPLPRCSLLIPGRGRRHYQSGTAAASMGEASLRLLGSNCRRASVRVRKVAGFSTELLQLCPEEPSLHVVFIPGNPGVVMFYKEFVEAVYELLEGTASVTAVGHVSHSKEDLEYGRTFSLQEQIDHKVEFIREEFQNRDVPLVLVGHSIGSFISLEIFKELEKQVKCIVGLYPFVTLNKNSLKQSIIGLTARTPFLCTTICFIVATLGLLPTWMKKALVKNSVGQEWSATAVDATLNYLLKYHTIRNVLYMADTEFKKFSEELDWRYLQKKQNEISFLFGVDDHWGPLSLFKEMSRKLPVVSLSIEREGHTHAFSCTEAGSVWVAHHVVDSIKRHYNSERAGLYQGENNWYGTSGFPMHDPPPLYFQAFGQPF